MQNIRHLFPQTKISLGLVAVCSLLLLSVESFAAKPNVLFIAVDDLRPDLGCYGLEKIHSPNIDRLAKQGRLFKRAYSQQAICMSSRASLLSGYRPDKGGIFRNRALFDHVPGALSINQHFMNNGYEVVAMGKIYHHASDYAQGWSRKWFNPSGNWSGRGYVSQDAQAIALEYDKKKPNSQFRGLGPAFESPDVPDNAYPDGLVAEHAIQELNRLKDGDKPFFLAIGFQKPHLPFNAPKKYWDFYSEEKIELAKNPIPPKGAPPIAFTDWSELRRYHGMPQSGAMPDELARKLIHGYYACISYTDALIGRVLDELERLQLGDNTVIVLWSDHGWKLGEHGMWAKHTNFELDVRVPLIIRAPDMNARGRSTNALCELVDIYPTLCEVAGLELPGHLQGTSLGPLLHEPDRPWKKAAFSQYPVRDAMGYSMRTARYRYTEWRATKSGAVVARELYDYHAEAGGGANLAEEVKNQPLVLELSQQLQRGYETAKPE